MIKEVKPIKLGYAYDFIELEKYTNKKDSIKVKYEDTGEDFTEWTLTNFGSLRIECGIIDYNEYEHPYEINMIIEYEPAQLPLFLYDINTLEGLEKNIVDMKSLEYISAIRLVAYRKFGIELNEFILFNTIFFDRFGQGMRLNYKDQKSYDYSFHNVVPLEVFKKVIKEYYYGSGAIPKDEDICPHCKQKWSLKNLRDCVQRERFVYHVDCNRFSLYEKTKKEFDYIVSRVFKNYELHAVRNEYGSEDYNGCWFIITTSEGDIKIGWRKRVIEIQWLQNYKKFNFNGINEDVTKKFSNDERYIHAWSIDKAIEYLKQARRTIMK